MRWAISLAISTQRLRSSRLRIPTPPPPSGWGRQDRHAPPLARTTPGYPRFTNSRSDRWRRRRVGLVLADYLRLVPLSAFWPGSRFFRAGLVSGAVAWVAGAASWSQSAAEGPWPVDGAVVALSAEARPRRPRITIAEAAAASHSGMDGLNGLLPRCTPIFNLFMLQMNALQHAV